MNRYLLIGLLLIVVIFTMRAIHRNSVRREFPPEAFIGNWWAATKPFLIKISYYDGRPPDTVLVQYDHPPGNRDILYWGTDSYKGRHDVPIFYGSSKGENSDTIFLGVHEIKILDWYGY